MTIKILGKKGLNKWFYSLFYLELNFADQTMNKNLLGILLLLSGLLNATSLSAQENEPPKERIDGIKMSKGLKFAILTFSVSSRDAVNDNNFLVNYVDQKKSSWDVRVDGGYIIKKDLGLG